MQNDLFKIGDTPSSPLRCREIEDAVGTHLRLSVEPHPDGAVLFLERVDQGDLVALDIYGAEMLCALILSARMSTPNAIPEEYVDGRFPVTIALSHRAMPTIEIASGGKRKLSVPVQLWDRLHVELMLACAHAREKSRRGSALH